MKKKYQLTNLILPLLALLVLAACGSASQKIKNVLETVGNQVVYDNGKQYVAKRISAPNGKDYYVVRIDSVNYYQAFLLQRDGWVLPRMFGVFVVDEHRSTEMPTMEMLLASPNSDLEKDWPTPDEPISLSEDTELRDYLDDSKAPDTQDYWTSTRCPMKGNPQNYGLRYSKSSHTYEYRAMTYNTLGCALLLKDAQLVDEEVPDSIYLASNGVRLNPVRYTAADGYEYYVVTLMDSLYTWYEAMAMEKDGWQLLRTQGTYFQRSSPRDFWNTLEHPTLHSNGLEPCIERFVGANIFQREGLSKRFDECVPSRTWLATPGSKLEAWKTINILDRDFKGRKMSFVALVKRIMPDADVKYVLKDGQTVQPQKVTGASGRVYYIVDPSDWRGFVYTGEEALSLQHDKWHLLTIMELEDMLGLENSIDIGKTIEQYNHQLFFSAFPQDWEYFLKDTDGELALFEPYFRMTREAKFGLSTWRLSDWDSYRVRLVYAPDEEVPDETVSQPDDRIMYGLKGLVHSVRQERLNSTYYADAYRPGGSAGFETIEMRFGRQGQLLRDQHGNLFRYDNKGNFLRGNTIHSTIERDKERRLLKYSISGEDNYLMYEYLANGKIKEEHYYGSVCTYTYDENGLVVSEHEIDTEDPEDDRLTDRTFTYYEFDEQGNWTWRAVFEKRYFGNMPDTTETVFVDKRKLQYYE